MCLDADMFVYMEAISLVPIHPIPTWLKFAFYGGSPLQNNSVVSIRGGTK